MSYRQRQPKDAWEYFKEAAARHDRDPADLWNQVGVTEHELTTRVLD